MTKRRRPWLRAAVMSVALGFGAAAAGGSTADAGAVGASGQTGGNSFWLYSGEECMCFQMWYAPGNGQSAFPTNFHRDLNGGVFYSAL